MSEHRELDLAQHRQPAVEVLRRDQLVEQLARQRRTGAGVARHAAQHVPFPAEVLPMNWLGSSTASHSTPLRPETAEVIDAGQQVMQAVAELVEQREHVVVRE